MQFPRFRFRQLSTPKSSDPGPDLGPDRTKDSGIGNRNRDIRSQVFQEEKQNEMTVMPEVHLHTRSLQTLPVK